MLGFSSFPLCPCPKAPIARIRRTFGVFLSWPLGDAAPSATSDVEMEPHSRSVGSRYQILKKVLDLAPSISYNVL